MRVSMKIIVVCMMLVVSAGCASKPNLRNTELATEAMERARALDAHTYAPREYKVALNLYRRMNKELGDKKYQDANQTALLVIDAANEAIRVSRIVDDIKK